MKPSHFISPRSMAQCHFAHDADPIERPDPAPSHQAVGWVCLVMLLAVVGAIAFKVIP